MKYHKRAERYVELDGPIDAVIAGIKEGAEGLINPCIESSYWYGDGNEYRLVGWIPMTDREKAAVDRKAANARESTRKRKEREAAAELAQYERLKKKFEDSK